MKEQAIKERIPTEMPADLIKSIRRLREQATVKSLPATSRDDRYEWRKNLFSNEMKSFFRKAIPEAIAEMRRRFDISPQTNSGAELEFLVTLRFCINRPTIKGHRPVTPNSSQGMEKTKTG